VRKDLEEWLKLLPLHPQRKRGSEKEEEKAG